jgi:ABC-type glycerol-3-phosphate transport system substrate-binding protein
VTRGSGAAGRVRIQPCARRRPAETGPASRWVTWPLVLIAGISLIASACGSAATTAPAAASATVTPVTSALTDAPTTGTPAVPVPTQAAAGACPNMPTTPITLTYREASGEHLSEEGVATLDAEFHLMYPNVELSRMAMPFADIMATETRQAGGPNPPDILLTNAYGLLGPLVAADLVLPLDDYAAGPATFMACRRRQRTSGSTTTGTS